LVQTFSVPGTGYLGLTTLSAPSTRLNPNLKPENVKSTEFGVELVMFDNKVNLDVAVYNIETTDLIFRVPVPAATGYSFFLENVGEVTNKGVEISLGFTVIDTSGFSWNSSLFYSTNDNKLVSLIDGIDTLVYTTTNSGNVSVQGKVGGGIGDIYGTIWSKDANGNHLVNASGRPIASNPDQLLGNAQPDWMGGLSNTMTYGNWNVNFLIDGRFGGAIFSEEAAYFDQMGISQNSLLYRETGTTLVGLDPAGAANTQSMTGQEYWGSNSAIAENHVYKQDNIRLREFSVGYNFPDVSSVGLESASIQVIGRNLFYFDKSAPDGIDPEAMLGTNIQGQGISSGNLPTTTSIGLNLTLKF
jgi:outer membrane receptor protein involved in Fe transport